MVLKGGNENFFDGKQKFIFQKKKKICGLLNKIFLLNFFLRYCIIVIKRPENWTDLKVKSN